MIRVSILGELTMLDLIPISLGICFSILIVTGLYKVEQNLTITAGVLIIGFSLFSVGLFEYTAVMISVSYIVLTCYTVIRGIRDSGKCPPF